MARRLDRRLPCSVALVRVAHLGKIQPHKILVPLKARVDHVDERAYYAAKMAQAFGAEVLVFHTRKPVSRFRNGEAQLSPAPWEKQWSPDMAHFIERLQILAILLWIAVFWPFCPNTFTRAKGCSHWAWPSSG